MPNNQDPGVNQTPLPAMEAPAALFLPQPEDLRKLTGKEEFSFFCKPVTNTIPSGVMSIPEIYELIKSKKYALHTGVLRSLVDKEQARKYKAKNFDYCTFSGVFTSRNDKSLVRHSKLLTIDFDHVPKIRSLKKGLIENPYFDTRLIFTSPSGDGIKWIVRIDLGKHSHLEYFRAIQRYVRANYKIEIDPSGKDVSRCCFLPYDPEAYIHPSYL